MAGMLKKLWEEIPFPSGGKKQEIVAWVIATEHRSSLRWQAIALIVIASFISYATGMKMYFGVP